MRILNTKNKSLADFIVTLSPDIKFNIVAEVITQCHSGISLAPHDETRFKFVFENKFMLISYAEFLHNPSKVISYLNRKVEV